MKKNIKLLLSFLFLLFFSFSCFFTAERDNPFDPENDKTVPMPTNLSVSSVTTNSIEISWDGSSSVTGYRIYRSLDDTVYTQVTSVAAGGSVTGINYADSGLTAGTIYFYAVSAYDNSGESEKCDPVSAVPMVNVSGLILGSATISEISMSWNGVYGANGYRIYRSPSSGGTYTQVSGNITSGTNYTDSGLIAGTLYYYKVTWYDVIGESAKSSSISGRTITSAPTGVSAGSATVNSLSVSWNSVAGATGYRVYRSTDGTNYSQVGGDITYGINYTDTGLSSATLYYYKVSAYNNAGESAQSSSSSSYTTPNTTNLSIAGKTSNSVSLSWSSVTGATGYRVYRSTTYNGTYIQVSGDITVTSYTDTGLSASTTYYYKLSAYNSGGESTLSDYISVLTYNELTVTTYTIAGSTYLVNNVPNSGYIAGTSALGGGFVNTDTGKTITAKGLCWSTSANPTISNSKATDSVSPSSWGDFRNCSITGLTVNTVYHVRAYATTSEGDTVYGEDVTFNSGMTFGTSYSGGLVFYNNGNGQGLIAGTADVSASLVWTTSSYLTVSVPGGATGNLMGTGVTNTSAIIAQAGGTSGYAAKNCANVGSGWFLPSRYELYLMYTNLHLNGKGSFSAQSYWSSTENSASGAYYVSFSTGTFNTGLSKINTIRVRAAKAF